MKKDETRKKVDKIYKQLNKIALKGRDHKAEYHRYVDSLVDKGDYAYLEMCMSDRYDIDVTKYSSVHSMKSKTWELVLTQTDSGFISRLRGLYKKEGIYQQGQEIRSFDPYYSSVAISGPYVAEEPSSRVAGSVALRTKYTLAGTQSQISIRKDADRIEISVTDAGSFQIGISKVIWATFSSPLYLDSGATQSSGQDLIVARLKEQAEGGIIATAAIRLHDITDYQTLEALLGKSPGDRAIVRIDRLFGSMADASAATGLEIDELEAAASVELEVLQIKRLARSEYESPYETSRISSISATGSGFPIGATFSSDIPTTHGGDYIVSVRRRAESGWADPALRYEELYYRVSVRKQNLLGTIKEIEHYQHDPKYLNIKSRYATYLGMKKTYLEVHKAGYDSPVLVVYENYSLSEESNLFARYKLAIQYLNS